MPLTKWEYNEVLVTDHAMCEDHLTITILNGYGEHGWEFTGTTRDAGTGTYFMMKRNMEWRDVEFNEQESPINYDNPPVS